ncbi:hypothetical protein JZX87_30375 [Agrobacterium sp. Ap1]|uniref:hypothetical protein n=1 Tax=Agrobacterium sp. Ap1 TaxID=2815337 RepID=UPI001A8D1AE9|nr:hypothetical protein [Agrobacterium sp. Ap1]MBO0145429.1 hypothetical protein [Agrobacterium sp. Ap1]
MKYQTFVDEFSNILAASVPDQNAKTKKLARKLDIVAVSLAAVGAIPLIADLPNYIPSVPLRAIVLLGLTAAILISFTLLFVSRSVSGLLGKTKR